MLGAPSHPSLPAGFSSATTGVPHVIQRHHKKVGPLQLLQLPLAICPAGHRVAPRATQPLQRRGFQQEPDDLRGLRASTSSVR